MTCGIYMIKNKKTGQMYIGQSVNIEERWRQHNKGYNIDYQYIDKAIAKYGIKMFDYIVVEELDNDINLLNKREKFWIQHYNTFKDNKHYNLVVGGSGFGSGKNHPSFKHYYRIITKGSNSANNKNYALINPNGEAIKYSIDREQLEEDIWNLENGNITEEELLKKEYRVVKHGFVKGKQRYVLISPQGKHLKHSINKENLLMLMFQLQSE